MNVVKLAYVRGLTVRAEVAERHARERHIQVMAMEKMLAARDLEIVGLLEELLDRPPVSSHHLRIISSN